MKKKLTAILIALTMAISLLPMPAMAVTETHKSQIQAAVTEMVKDYAQKVYRPNADDEAFDAFFRHGFYGKGRKLTLDESHAFVSSIFNANVMQEAMIHGITAAIASMQELNLPAVLVSGGPGWHNYYCTFQCYGYIGETKVPANYLGKIATAKDIYGTVYYPGPCNENDDVMELLVGTADFVYTVKRTAVRDQTATFTLEMKLSDEFNFSGDYSDIANKGYDTSTDDTLNNLGYLLTFMGLDEFEWEFNTTMQIEVPTNCSHSYDNSYHWTLDKDSHTLISDTASGFTSNYAEPIAVIDSTTGETSYQYKLEDTVVLRHDRPWVVEYTLQPVKSLSLSPFPTSSTAYPYFLQHSTTHVWVPYYEKVNSDNKDLTHRWYYDGVEILGKFGYTAKRPFSFHVENVINGSGNMPYVTIYDDTGAVVFGPEPLNDYWTSNSIDTTRVLTETDTTRLSGTDILIRYIGSQSNRITHDQMELYIWENGKNPTPDEGSYTAPTCTEAGGIKRHCLDCGGDYLTDIEPAKGHSFGDYADDGNTTCTEDGTKTRKCTVCGESETVTVEGSAVGHSFSDYTDDGNSSCTDVGTKTRTCTICGVAETIPNEGTADGHDFGTYLFDHNATCTDDGTKTAVCKVCGEKDTVTAEGSATGHRYEAAVTAPTCTAEGYTTYTCHCGDSYVSDRTPVAPHTEVIDPAVDSTCVQQGLTEGKHCAVCGKVTVPQMSAPLGSHKWDAGTVVTAPTLTQPGTLMYTCEICGKTNHMSITELPSTGFEDVPADAYYAAAVAWAKENGITSGITDTLFGSDMGCTRGQVVTFLWAAAGRPEATATENPFTDVTESDYFYKPVLWAAEQGITGGIGEGLFGPDATCTRGQIVTFLWRAKNSPTVNGTPDFNDVTATDWFAQPVAWAAENEVTGGIGNGMFGPNNTCTRAQVVTFLYKIYS